MGPRESVCLAGFLGKKAAGGGGGGRKKVVCGVAQVKEPTTELPTHCLRGLEQAFSIRVCCSSSEE